MEKNTETLLMLSCPFLLSVPLPQIHFSTMLMVYTLCNLNIIISCWVNQVLMNKNNQFPPLGMDLFEGWEWGRLERAGSGVRNAPGSLHYARQFAGFTFTRLIRSVSQCYLLVGLGASIVVLISLTFLTQAKMLSSVIVLSIFLISLQVLYLPCRNHIWIPT